MFVRNHHHCISRFGSLSVSPLFRGAYPRRILRFQSWVGVSRNGLRAVSTQPDARYDHFFRYDSGRWLWNEEKRLRESYRPFNVEALKRVAAEAVGSHSCIEMVKIPDDTDKRCFRLLMDDGIAVIASLPCSTAGPPLYATASEVATMDFGRTILGIPVPKVHAWSATAENPVEAEYILTEEGIGKPLYTAWGDMEIDDKTSIVEDLVDLEKKLISVSFAQYGNIYYASDPVPGCQPLKLVKYPTESLKQDAEARFVIGPIVSTAFWDGERASMAIDRGPWDTPEEWLSAIGAREIAWIGEFARPIIHDEAFLPPSSESQTSKDAHLTLYGMFLDIIPSLVPEDRRFSGSVLWHSNLNRNNLLSTGSHITGLVNWREAWAAPLILNWFRPDLVNYHGEVITKLPENYDDLEDESYNKESITKKVEKSILLLAYEMHTSVENSLLSEVMNVPHGLTRRQTVGKARNTWENDILPFRQCLIRIERHWNELGMQGPCPIHFTEEDKANIIREGEGWNALADFWDEVDNLVQRDGWTYHDCYELALEMFTNLKAEILKELTGEERERFLAQTRWVEEKASQLKAKAKSEA